MKPITIIKLTVVSSNALQKIKIKITLKQKLFEQWVVSRELLCLLSGLFSTIVLFGPCPFPFQTYMPLAMCHTELETGVEESASPLPVFTLVILFSQFVYHKHYKVWSCVTLAGLTWLIPLSAFLPVLLCPVSLSLWFSPSLSHSKNVSVRKHCLTTEYVKQGMMFLKKGWVPGKNVPCAWLSPSSWALLFLRLTL